jgi:hypothetical protein
MHAVTEEPDARRLAPDARVCSRCGVWWISARGYRRTTCESCWLARQRERTAQSWERWKARAGLSHGTRHAGVGDEHHAS